MKKLKLKICVVVGSVIVSSFIFLAPAIVIIGIFAAPFQMINDLFVSIGDIFGELSDEDDIVLLIEEYFRIGPGQELLIEVYQPYVSNELRINVPLNYLAIPNFLLGIEKPEEHIILEMIEKMCNTIETVVPLLGDDGEIVIDENGNEVFETIIEYELHSINEYIDGLYEIDLFKIGFQNHAKSTIIKYVEYFDSFYDFGGIGDDYTGQYGDGELMYPFKSKAVITAPYGWYNPFGDRLFHDAIDLAFPKPGNCGVPIYAVNDGVVVKRQGANISQTGNFGHIENGNMVVKYVHMQEGFMYEVGTYINKGDYIGSIGNTGKSTGCHLHLEIVVGGTSVDPEQYIDFRNPKLP